MTEGRSLLVHGFAHHAIVAELSGILGQRASDLVNVQARNGIVALASPIGFDDVDEAFKTTEAVTALALDHAEVLAAIAALHDVVPLRLGTLVSGRQALADLCEAQAGAMQRVLHAIGGCVEFGVRIVRQERDESQTDLTHEKPTDGRSYLRARADARGLKKRASESQSLFCASLVARLQALAAVTALTSDAGRMANNRLLDVACLVPRRGKQSFEQQVLAKQGEADSLSLALELTGPWPAYSFVAGPLAEVH